MKEFFHKAFWIFFDKTIDFSSKTIYFIIIIWWLFLLNDVLWLSNNWVMSNKIDNIQQIERIKKNNINNYSLDFKLIEKINKLENNVIDRESVISNILNYFRNITLWKIEIDFWYLFSVHWLWILILLIMIPQIYKNWFWDLLGTLFLVIIMMWLWYYFIEFLYWFIWVENKNIKYSFNYWFPIFILIVITISTKNKK